MTGGREIDHWDATAADRIIKAIEKRVEEETNKTVQYIYK